MRFIGITGGVGAGKSAILEYLSHKANVRVLIADEIAHDLMKPGSDCYRRIKRQFAKSDIFKEDTTIDPKKLAELIFGDESKRRLLNEIVHPAVKEYVTGVRDEELEKGELEFLVLEAALLVEDHYDVICDELWYVYTSESRRRARLREQRGYTDDQINDIFASQMTDAQFRAYCHVIIDNNGTAEDAFDQVEALLAQQRNRNHVFGLDIGTRNIVGTVGYKNDEDEFIVTAQSVRQHETRAMLDGQIHDIGRVARTIGVVKRELEQQIGEKLSEVCIAAAGRVLRTVTTRIEFEYPEETVVSRDDLHTLDLLGIEKAQEILNKNNDTRYKFYCVGYTVMKYYLNDETFISLEDHRAFKIGEDIIVTFLPEDVVDGLYSAVGHVGLTVANMTLEPIAAINVAIPENYRMLNIALVDVGAGTSDISLTRDGSIIAYGMIPMAGDELTEVLVQHYLVDFQTAEQMKLDSTTKKDIEYSDIMSIHHKIPAKEIWELLAPVVDKITTEVANKIKELNGDKTVSACFVVGGGGKVHGYTEMLAEKLGLPPDRVALRGEEVLSEVKFEQEDIQKDPLLVTPIGICLNYYDQKNNFIMVRFNGERLKLYDNNRLTIVDAALQAGFPNDQLFPRRGNPINFTVNGIARIVRGEVGEPAYVTMNGEPAHINTPLEPNCEITIEPSTVGDSAVYRIDQLEEYTSSTMSFEVNGKWVTCPKFVEVNGILEPASYAIRDGDQIEMRGYYTVGQLAEFMDVAIDLDYSIRVNNREATTDSLIYENFEIEWTTTDSPDAESAYYANGGDNTMGRGYAAEQEEQEARAQEEGKEPGTEADSAAEQPEDPGPPPTSAPVSAKQSPVEVSPGTETNRAAHPAAAPAQSSPAPVRPAVAAAAKAEAGPQLAELRTAGPQQAANSDFVSPAAELQELLENERKKELAPPSPDDTIEQTAARIPGLNLNMGKANGPLFEDERAEAEEAEEPKEATCIVTVNGEAVALMGKERYIFVDIFDRITFDLNAGGGRAIVTLVNGHDAQYSEEIHDGDVIELYWKENKLKDVRAM